MSRVERKRLEKEAKKKNKTRLFKSKEKEVKKSEESLETDESAKLPPRLDASRDKKVDDNIDFVTKKIEDRFIARESQNDDPIKKGLENNQNSKNELKMKRLAEMAMKTADKIVSVEDEEMRLKRRRAYLDSKNEVDPDDKPPITVDDIRTEEDINLGIYDRPQVKEIKDIDANLEADVNINEVKHIDIERAPFEDVVKVVESRIAAEKIRHEEQKKEEEKILKQEQIKKEVLEKELRERERLKTQQLNLDMGQDQAPKPETSSKKKGWFKRSMDEKNQEEVKGLDQASQSEELSSQENKVEEVKAEEKVQEIKQEAKAPILVAGEKIDSMEDLPKKGGFKSFLKKLCIFLIAIIVLVYIAGCLVFKDRYFVNTSINGIKADLKTPGDIDKLASDKTANYKLNISGRNDVKDSINGSDIGIAYVKDGSAAKIKADQGFFAWPLAFLDKTNIDGKLNVKYDEAKLNDVVKKLNIFDKKYIKAPVSAFPRFDEKKKDYVVDKGDLGSTPIEASVKNFVASSVKAEATKVEYPASVYKAQKNKADDKRIEKAIAQLKEYDKVKVVYDFEKEKYVAGTKDISTMFNVASEDDYKVELSKDKVRDFVRSLSRKYSTYGDAREIPSASTGGKLKVTGGIYGWLIDREKETDYLYELVKAKKSENNRKPIYAQTAITRENQDLGNEFIEIDLTKQHMWFVRDGKVLVETPIVSGNPNRGDATPPGIYPVNYKTRHATLKGPGYSSPVSYWMPFNGDIGIHDASWQPVYGGSRYLYAGSHGCINTPYSKVAQFYALTKEGMPVVVHY